MPAKRERSEHMNTEQGCVWQCVMAHEHQAAFAGGQAKGFESQVLMWAGPDPGKVWLNY